MQKDLSVLAKPLQELGLSKEFLEMAEANKFSCIDDILKNGLHNFPHLPQSGYRMMRELVNLMDKNGLLYLTM